MTKQRIKSILMYRCKCCLRERQSKDMWNEHFYHGDTENYGVKLSNCFQLPWHEPLSGTDRICFLCIGRLQDAVSFKSQIMEAQKFKSELLDDALSLDDVADIEQKIEEFLEKHLNITVAFELNKQTPTIRYNSYLKIKPGIETNIDQDSIADSTPYDPDQESMCDVDESIATDIDRATNPLGVSNDCEDITNTEVEYLDEEYFETETVSGDIKTKMETTDIQNSNIQVKLVTQDDANKDQAVVIVGKNIIKKINERTSKKNMLIVNKVFSKPLNIRTAQCMETDATIAAEPEPVQVQYKHDIPEPSEQTDMSLSIQQDENSTLSHEYEDNEDSVQLQNKRKTRSSKMTNAKNYQNVLISYTEQRRNYLIERTKHQENLVALLITTNATPVQCKSDKGYQCGFCPTNFYDLCDLRTHTHERHGKDEKATYMSETSLSNFVVRLDITDLQCIKCGASLKDLDAAWNHLTFHGIQIHTDMQNRIAAVKSEGDQLKCFVCEKNITFWGLMKHMNGHFGNFICEQCGEGFICKRYLDFHARHHEKGHYQCPHCSKQFSTRIQWTLHKSQIHEKRQNYLNRIVCSICKARFASGKDKEKHLHLVHKAPLPKKNRVKCPRCDKVLSSKKGLKRHDIAVHLKNIDRLSLKVRCPKCDKMLSDKRVLKRHNATFHEKNTRARKCNQI